MYLRQPMIAQIVVDSIHKSVELGHFGLEAYVVMANHVHLLVLPKISPDRMMKSLKGLPHERQTELWDGRVNRSGRKNRTITGCAIVRSSIKFGLISRTTQSRPE